jgi:hypothetical protein
MSVLRNAGRAGYKIGHDIYCPYPSQYIIHSQPHISYISVKASLNKLWLRVACLHMLHV